MGRGMKKRKSIDKLIKIFKRIIGTGSLASVFSNMAILTGGNVVARLISFATIPIISRLYSPQDFGVLAVYASSLALLIPLANFRYSVTIPIARNERSGINLVFLCFSIQIIMTLFVAFILFFAREPIFSLVSMQKMIPYWWLVPLGFMGIGIYETLTNWATRIKDFRSIAKTKASQAIFSSAFKIGLGYMGFRPLGLLLGHIASQVAGISLLGRKFKETSIDVKRAVSLSKMIFLAKRFAKFPIYQIPSRFLLALSVQMPVLFIAATFGSDTAGLFGMAVSVVAIPMQLFGQTLSQAYYGEIAKIGKNKPHEIKELSIGLIKRLIIISLPIFLIFVSFAPTIFSVILGSQWTKAGEFAVFLSFYLLSQFISSPFVHTLNVLEMQSLFFVINVTRVVLIVSIFVLSKIFLFSALLSIAIYSIVLCFHYVGVMLLIFKVLK
jgi:O-antigen/teichoic acid export membrane protein